MWKCLSWHKKQENEKIHIKDYYLEKASIKAGDKEIDETKSITNLARIKNLS